MRTVIYAGDALDGIDRISAYLEQFSEGIAKKYRIQVQRAIQELAVFPAKAALANADKDPELRRMVFKKRTIVLYRYDKDTVYIEAVLDARSNWK